VTGCPGTDGGSGLLCDLELDRPPRLSLNNHCSVVDNAGKRNVANRDGDQVATSKLAIDGEIEECQIPFRAGHCSRVRMLQISRGLRGGF
jgi:hypothetical protein